MLAGGVGAGGDSGDGFSSAGSLSTSFFSGGSNGFFSSIAGAGAVAVFLAIPPKNFATSPKTEEGGGLRITPLE
jgi:hypothetical protein